MTRVNIVPVRELTPEHLGGEYREITRLPGSLRKSLNRKSKPFSMDEIPKEYKLGPGHVKFFYDKMLFLKKRYEEILEVRKERGLVSNFTDSSIFIPEDKRFYNDYTPTPEALEINRQRIAQRLKESAEKKEKKRGKKRQRGRQKGQKRSP